MKQQSAFLLIPIEERFPDKDLLVHCEHEDSGNKFACYRTNDCNTGEEKWWNGARPTHWLEKKEDVFVLTKEELQDLWDAAQ